MPWGCWSNTMPRPNSKHACNLLLRVHIVFAYSAFLFEPDVMVELCNAHCESLQRARDTRAALRCRGCRAALQQ